MTTMDRRSPTAVYAIVACLSVAAIGEMTYLHLKMVSLSYEYNLIAELHENTRRELQGLRDAMKLFDNIEQDETSVGHRRGPQLDTSGVELHRTIRAIWTRQRNGTKESVLNATEHPNERREQQTPGESKDNVLLNKTDEAMNILEIKVSSHGTNQTNKQIRMDSCATSENSISMGIKVSVDNEGKCHCVATPSNNKSFWEKSPQNHPRPRVFLSARKLKGTAGVPIELQCNFTRGHGQTIKWMKDSGEILEEQYFTHDNQSLILKISDPSKKGNGNYSCYIESNTGEDKKTIQVVFVEKDCSAWKQSGYIENGIYAISPDDGQSFDIYCDMETDGGGWNVIQRRQDGSVDFYRTWGEYKNGFGNITGEFWLGNDKIHRLTESQAMSIRFDLVDSDGKEAFSVYEIFYVANETDEYRLHVESYFGTAGDSFLYHYGMKFSTKDKGYSIFGTRCAESFRGAWWYRACHRSNLNGEYIVGRSTSYAQGIKWMTFNGGRGSLTKTEMKIRPFADGNKESLYMKRRY